MDVTEISATIKLADRGLRRFTRAQRAWFTYEWGCQAFPTTVVGVFFGPFITSVAALAADATGFVQLLGIPMRSGSFFAYAVSFSVAIQALLLPVLGAIADRTARKARMLLGAAMLGAGFCSAMFLVSDRAWLLGGLLFVGANVAFGAAATFYNALLPDVASAERRTAVSSAGWSTGYIGGGVLLGLNLLLLARGPALGLDEAATVRICLLSAGIWWAVFTLIAVPRLSLSALRADVPQASLWHTVRGGFAELASTLRDARSRPQIFLFLLAFLCYSDAISTVTTVATVFGHEEIGMSISSLTMVMLMIQFVGAAGTLLCGWIAERIGTKATIAATLVIWCGTMVYANAFLTTELDFVILAAAIALVIGGSQALSRAAFSRMVPPGREAEYFGIYAVSERSTSWLGPLLFGLALQITGSYRTAILSLTLLFGTGLLLVLRVNFQRAYRESGRDEAHDSLSTAA